MRASRVAPCALLVLALLALPSAKAGATPTAVFTSPTEPDLVGDWNLVPPSGAGHEGILGYLYGWRNLTRIDDFGGDPGDRWWSFTSGAEVSGLAMFAYNQFTFGYLDGTTGFHSVLSLTGAGPGYLMLPTRHFAASDPLSRFALFAAATGTLFDSAQAEDHMVTFQITGNADQYGRDFSANHVGDFVIGWEDLPFGISDRDYNDLVLEVRGAQPIRGPLPAVPEPSTAVLLASALAVDLVVRKKASGRPEPNMT